MQLDTVRIFSADVSRAKAFYQDVLGIELESDSSRDGYLVFRSGSITIVIETESADEATGELLVGRFTGLSFRVPNLDESYKSLVELGVPFLTPPEEQPWGGWLTAFRDPDNNILTLVQLPT